MDNPFLPVNLKALAHSILCDANLWQSPDGEIWLFDFDSRWQTDPNHPRVGAESLCFAPGIFGEKGPFQPFTLRDGEGALRHYNPSKEELDEARKASEAIYFAHAKEP